VSGYVELHCHSCFSLLDGSSTPETLLDQALHLGMPALALTDHDGLYGAVRFYTAARERGVHPVLGAELTLQSEHHLTLLAETRQGYANLCWLITRAQLGESKGHARLPLALLHGHTEGLIALTGCRLGLAPRPLLEGDRDRALAALRTLRDLFGRGRLYVELQQHLYREDADLVADLADLAESLGLPLVATNNVHYARRENHRLADVLTAIRHNVALQDAHQWLRPNSESYLKSADEMAELFAPYPQALENTLAIAERCHVELAFREHALPPQSYRNRQTADDRLRELCERALPAKYPPEAREPARRQLDHELKVIAQTELAGYFLLVWEIVDYSRKRGIQVRGRGSAANSIVAYLLNVTNVDPLAHDLLFERFLSGETRVMPDIDLDFCARRREEVIQHIYETFGESHVGMVCNYVTYRKRSAIRDVGKALGMSPEVLGRLSKMLRGISRLGIEEAATDALGAPKGLSGRGWRQFLTLCEEIQGLPRHLSIHVGGMCITAAPLTDFVPLERATMPGRVVIQWDKDSVEDAGLIKTDILSLRTLAAIDECLKLVEDRHGVHIDLDRLPLDDPAVYDQLRRADTVGAFQVESRAQQQALVKMQPREFADIVVEVALIRPGPLQGNMVYPFFQRRMGLQPVTYPHPLLEPILKETLGVVVFQEQVIRIAMVMGGFAPGEADMLRRAMSRHRSSEEMAAFRQRFIEGALARGVSADVAEQVFGSLAGFASYGFCKSHAAAFAKTSYDTLYLRAHYPAEYYCALLNNQPMGFYAPRVLVGDARQHGVRVLGVHVNRSAEQCTIEDGAIRLGLEYVDGLGEAAIERLLDARDAHPFRGLADLCRRTRLPRRAVENLILAGGLSCWEPERRKLLWELGQLRYQEDGLPLEYPVSRFDLEPMTAEEALAAEFSVTGLVAEGHLMEPYRPQVRRLGAITSEELRSAEPGQEVTVAGLVAVRQAPPTAKGFVFLTLEDEYGLMNIIVRPQVFDAQRTTWSTGLILMVQGVVEQFQNQINVMANQAWQMR